jgi:hypothetical protein
MMLFFLLFLIIRGEIKNCRSNKNTFSHIGLNVNDRLRVDDNESYKKNSNKKNYFVLVINLFILAFTYATGLIFIIIVLVSDHQFLVIPHGLHVLSLFFSILLLVITLIIVFFIIHIKVISGAQGFSQ